jgi:hypothetical protein
MTTAIYAALERRYQAPEYALFYEVANGPGSHLRRYADALAMSLFPSRGLDLHGFEIKTKRGDWLHERKHPEKAEEICAFCDYWWLVAGSKEIVRMDELPSAWGLLVMQGKTLRTVKPAPRLEAKPIDRKLLAAILRRAHEQAMSSGVMRAAKEASYTEGLERGRDDAQTDIKCLRHEKDTLQDMIDQFETNSGIKLNQWHAGKIGQLVRTLQGVDARAFQKVGDCFQEAAAKLHQLACQAEQYAQAMGEVAIPKVAQS